MHYLISSKGYDESNFHCYSTYSFGFTNVIADHIVSLQVTFLAGKVAGSLAVEGESRGQGASLQKDPDVGKVVLLGGRVEERPPLPVLEVDLEQTEVNAACQDACILSLVGALYLQAYFAIVVDVLFAHFLCEVKDQMAVYNDFRIEKVLKFISLLLHTHIHSLTYSFTRSLAHSQTLNM